MKFSIEMNMNENAFLVRYRSSKYKKMGCKSYILQEFSNVVNLAYPKFNAGFFMNTLQKIQCRAAVSVYTAAEHGQMGREHWIRIIATIYPR